MVSQPIHFLLISRLAADFAGRMRTRAAVRKGAPKDAAFVQERAEMVWKVARREATMFKLPCSFY